MSNKLVEAAAEFLSRDTSTKQAVSYNVEESFLLSQEEFQTLSEEDQESYINQLVELKKSTLASYAKKASRDARMAGQTAKDFERHEKSSRKPEHKQGARIWADTYKQKAWKREAGVNRAIDKLAK